MKRSQISFIKGTLSERVIVAVAAPLLGLCCAWCYLQSDEVLIDSDLATQRFRLAFKVFHYLCKDLFGSACIFLAIAFIWALFQPEWVRRLLVGTSHRVWRAICLVLLAMMLTALFGKLIDWLS